MIIVDAALLKKLHAGAPIDLGANAPCRPWTAEKLRTFFSRLVSQTQKDPDAAIPST